MLQVFGIIFFLSFASCKDISVEVCEMKTFDAICQQPDEVLVIKQALLGRMKKGKCMLEDFGFFNCSSDVKAEMDAFCTGRKECHVKVDDTSFTRATPCHADLKNHLQLTYSCVKVLFPDSSCSVVDFTGSSSSSPSLSPSPAFPPSGFISSVIVEKTGCGLTNSPLTLRAGEGQRINLTLHDVTYGMMLIRASKDRQVVDSTPGRGSTEDQKTLGLHFMISGTCRVYATVRDSDSQDLLGRGSSICGSQGSVVNVFTSTSNVIEIRFMGAQKVKDSRQSSSSSSSSSSPSSSIISMDDILKSPQFLFQYSVIGCSEGELPKETWKRKSGDGRSVILGCPGSDVTWEMICNQNNQWEGHARECSQNGILPFISGISKIYTSLVVGSIAVVVSCCVLIFGVVCIRRNLKLRSNSRSMCADEQYGLRSACHEGVKGEAKMHSTGSYIPEEMYQDGNEYARMRMQLREQLSKSHGSRNFLVRIAADNSGPTVVQEPNGYDEQNEHIYESADTLKLQLEMCSNQPSIPVFPGPQVSIQMAKPFQEQVTYESTANKYPVTKPTPLPKPPSEIIQKQTIPHHLQTFDETKQGNYSL